jgi:hypothetical protein
MTAEEKAAAGRKAAAAKAAAEASEIVVTRNDSATGVVGQRSSKYPMGIMLLQRLEGMTMTARASARQTTALTR